MAQPTVSPASEDQFAALSQALEAIGDRWSLLVTAALLDGPARFGDVQEAVRGIAPNILSQRLRRLEERGLVVAQPYSARPPRYLYELTETGRGLAGALRLLAGWGARHAVDGTSDAPRHSACGTPLEARWHCPVCREAVGAPGDDVEPDLYYA